MEFPPSPSLSRPPRGKRNLFCAGGWLLSIVLLCFLAPRLYQRLIVHVPGVDQKLWRETLDRRKTALASTQWKDTRPLHLFLGDSQIERGNWYDLFSGVIAIRNCGLSRATIEDVTTLVGSVPEKDASVLLMCGINDLGRRVPGATCLERYDRLLEEVIRRLKPRRIIVLSVMPLRQSPLDTQAREINRGVTELNQKLAALCKERQATFIDVNAAISDSAGGLSAALTSDGLHLNSDGYRAISAVLSAHLTPDLH